MIFDLAHSLEPWFSTRSLGQAFSQPAKTPAQTELRIHGTDEVLVVPVVTSTKVLELKEMLSMKLGIYPNELQIFTRAGGYWRLQMDHEEIGRKVRVKGIKSFTPERAKYEHPFLIIGAGHIGLRHGIYLLQHDHPNFVIVDRRDKVGGTSWIAQANKTSKLQTELGTYHLQYDEINPVPKSMSTWPSRDELLDHFAQVSAEYGLMPHIQLQTNVKSISVNGTSSASGPLGDASLEATENYTGNLPPEPTGKGLKSMTVSCVFMYPGNLSLPRQFEYKGEDVFDGTIEYAMFDNIDYSVAVTGKRYHDRRAWRLWRREHPHVLRVFLRRRSTWSAAGRNLACPRVCSWFANQSDPPVSGALLLESMEPAYNLIGFDPWSFHSVIANSARTNAHIAQKSRL